MFRIIALFPVLISFSFSGELPSPWIHEQTEMTSKAPTIIPGIGPIKYPTIWEREREKLEYMPHFMPNIVTFDWYNRPVIRVGVHDEERFPNHATVYYASQAVEKSYIQTMDANGNWVVHPLHGILDEKIEGWGNDRIYSGVAHGRHETVVFDKAGDAYTIVKTKNHGAILLHTQKGFVYWNAYSLPEHYFFQLETTASDRPPVIFLLQKFIHENSVESVISIIAPEKSPIGLINLAPITIASDTKPKEDSEDRSGNLFGAPGHSGLGDLTVTVANKTHVVYGSKRVDPADTDGTPQYIATYDHLDQSLSAPYLLGTTKTLSTNSSQPDSHNGPAIVVDSQGYLHVVLGAHNQPFKYLVSTVPNSSETWSAPVEIGNRNTMWQTYVSLVIDAADTLHLVSRSRDKAGTCRGVDALHYMRKQKDDESFVDLGELVVPNANHYSVWYHKLTIDERGRLFVAYFYYSHSLTDDELDAYHTKWPDETVEANATNAHDPVILMSDDGGDRWRIAVTKDFESPELAIQNHTATQLSLYEQKSNGSLVGESVEAKGSWVTFGQGLVLIINDSHTKTLQMAVKLENGVSYQTFVPVRGSWAIPQNVHAIQVTTEP